MKINGKVSSKTKPIRVDTEIFVPILCDFMKENDIDSVRKATKEMGKFFRDMKLSKSKIKKPQIKF